MPAGPDRTTDTETRPPSLPDCPLIRDLLMMCSHQRTSLQELPLLLPRVVWVLWEVQVRLPRCTGESPVLHSRQMISTVRRPNQIGVLPHNRTA
jgi:hypothetical protein